jgi:hypothetical protein
MDFIYDPNDRDDPANWPVGDAPAFIGVDVGWIRDYSCIITTTVHNFSGNSILAVRHIQQLPLGATSKEVCDAAVKAALGYRNCRIILDTTNSQPLAAELAGRFGESEAPKRIICASISAGHEHADAPTTVPVSVGAARAQLMRWTVSKSRLIEQIAAEAANGSIKFTKSGDAEKLAHEMSRIERIERKNGYVSYASPEGDTKLHDDLVMALSLSIFGCRRLAPVKSRVSRPRSPRYNSLAWT